MPLKRTSPFVCSQCHESSDGRGSAKGLCSGCYHGAWNEARKARLAVLLCTVCGLKPQHANGMCPSCNGRAYRAAHYEAEVARLARQRERRRAQYAEADKAYQRAYYLAHPDEEHEKRARRRARLRDAFVAPVSLSNIFERDGGVCHLCRRKVTRSAATLDHLVPLSRGGTHEPANVALAHRSCNLRRWANGPAQLRLLD